MVQTNTAEHHGTPGRQGCTQMSCREPRHENGEYNERYLVGSVFVLGQYSVELWSVRSRHLTDIKLVLALCSFKTQSVLGLYSYPLFRVHSNEDVSKQTNRRE